MKNFFKSSASIGLTVLISSVVVAGIVYAGSLTAPSGVPAASSYTLDDIYARLTTDSSASAGAHSLSTTTSPAASFHTLTQIYSAIPTIDATKVIAGTSYLGVSGTAYPASPVKTGQTLCYNDAGNAISCTGTGEDGEDNKGVTRSYTDNGNGTITDNATGLVWQKCSVGSSGAGCATGANTALTYVVASTTCANLVLGSQSDWRVPNINELFSLVDHSNTSPAINTVYFPNTELDRYWTSTAASGNGGSTWAFQWYVYFSNGFVDNDSRGPGGGPWFVRCVRGGQ